uniref:Helicase ATP-binding domain-containing protein n=1 Tax=viral metagenome TaxID=1070528 RepID=A0A6C0CQI7_9ZZZZ
MSKSNSKTKIKKLDKKIKISQKCNSNLYKNGKYIDQLINIADSIDFDEEGKLVMDCLKELKELENNNKQALLENDNNTLYPHLNDKYFNKKIFKKREFNETKMEKQPNVKDIEAITNSLCQDQEFELAPHQMFVRNFLSFQTPYNGLLLFHGVGTGKTCSAISVSEEMREYNKQMNITKEILIVASPNVQTNFKLQLFNEKKLREVNGLWNIKSCTGNKFLKEINPMNMKGLPKTDVIKQINRIIKQNYKFLGYTEFSNYISKIIDKYSTKGKKNEKKALRNEFSNRLIIIDEVHNLRITDKVKDVKKSTENLKKVVVYANNLKLLLLSATPMYDNAREIVWILNILNLNDNRFPIEENEIFDSNNNILTEDGKGKELLVQKSTGYISYIRGENVFTFPYRIYPNDMGEKGSLEYMMKNKWEYPSKQANDITISGVEGINYLDLMTIPICDYQSKVYNFNIQYLKDKKKGFIKDEDKNSGIPYVLLDGLVQILNFSYPHKKFNEDNPGKKYDIVKRLYGIDGLKRNMFYTKETMFRSFAYKSDTIKNYGRLFDYDNLGKYSNKIEFIMKKIINKKGELQSKGKILIYSRYIHGCIIPLALALEEVGFTRYGGNSLFKEKPKTKYTKHNHKLRYIMITGDSVLSPNKLEEINAFNSPDNKDGEEIKVIIVSKAASEGLDFQCIRQVHIVDPWYNIYRIEQIIGRAVRNQSHCLLPFIERNVEIYLHATLLKDTNIESIDFYLYRLAEKKVKSIAAVSKILKENAIDCFLNSVQSDMSKDKLKKKVDQILSSKEYNKIKFVLGHKDNTPVCDFNKCEIKCENNKKINSVNEETYNNYYMVLNVDKIIQRIRLLFKDEYIYSKKELIKRVQHIKNYPREQILFALDQLIKDKNEYLVDMFNRIGTLKNIDDYYFFQPLELNDENTQMYDNKHLIDNKWKQLDFILPEKIKEEKISSNKKIHNILIMLRNNLNDMKNRKWLSKEEKKNFSKIAAWTIYLLKEFNDIDVDKFYRYAMYTIFEQLSGEDKLLLLKHLWSDDYIEENEEERYAKFYFKKFIKNNIIGIVMKGKIKYYILENNNWNKLPSNKDNLTKDMYKNDKNKNKNIGILEIGKNKGIDYRIKNTEKENERAGAICGTGDYQKADMVVNNNKLFRIFDQETNSRYMGMDKYYMEKSSIKKIYGNKYDDKLSIKHENKTKSVKLSLKHLCVEHQLLLTHFQEENFLDKRWIYFYVELIANK